MSGKQKATIHVSVYSFAKVHMVPDKRQLAITKNGGCEYGAFLMLKFMNQNDGS